MRHKTDDSKRSRGGRKLKANPSVYRYTVNMNDRENVKFRSMMRTADADNISKFILSLIFGREIKVVKIDKATTDYYIRLTNFYNQFQAIGNNYNQIVRALKSNFGEKRGLQMLHKLEQETIKLVIISKDVIQLTHEFEDKHLK